MDSVTSMSGSEIARLVLGYLQSQGTDEKAWNNLALEFCKLNKTYLREEYSLLSRGIKVKYVSKPRSLVDIFREFIEIEEIANTFFEDVLKRYDEIPADLLRLRSLKDKVQYACRMFNSAGDSNESIQKKINRKRPIYQSEYDSDSSPSASPQATNVQDLPGYSRPPTKRRKIFDPSLIINNRKEPEIICLDDSSKSDLPKVTPLKSSVAQDPMSSKHLHSSASKINYPGKVMSEKYIASDRPDYLAQIINSAFASNVSTVQLPDKLGGIAQEAMQQDPTFDHLIQDVYFESYDQSMLSSSGSTSKAECDENESEKRQLDTPVPNDANRSGRYDLRSQKKKTEALNTSTETKRKKNGKAQIISNERVNILPDIAMQSIIDEPISVSDTDSEGAVTTTSQQQPQPQPQSNEPRFLLIQDPSTGLFYLTANHTNTKTDTQSQPSTSTAPVNIIDSSQSIITSDQLNMDMLKNYNFINSIASNQYVVSTESIQTESLSTDEDIRNRFIVINNEDVNKEGDQPVQITQQPAEEVKESEKKQEKTLEQLTEKPFSQLKQISEQKVSTPKELIRPNITSSSRSLSTPRNRNPHVRVLDFNTPNRFRLSEILEGKTESFSNTLRFFSETPQNRSITSSMPSSAPPKIDSAIQTVKKLSKNLSDPEPFVPANEDTVISAGSDTPKVRKIDRKSVVRTISAHKETNPEENEKRLKRVAKTKKKICSEDGDSNGSETNNKKETVKAQVSSEDAMAEWQRIRSASNNPDLFVANLREQYSKKQEIDISTGRKKRTRSKAKKKTTTRTKQVTKSVLDESAKSVDISMNSSFDPDTLNSTETNLEAKLLEENLKSAKKITPIKQETHLKSAKKRIPIGKLQTFKLMPSPKNKALKRLKSKKSLTSTQTSEETKQNEPQASCSTSEKPTAKPTESEQEQKPKPENETQKPTESDKPKSETTTTTDVVEVAQNLISMHDVILQQENQRKQAQNTEIQSDSVSMSQPTMEVPIIKTISEPMPSKIDSDLLKYVTQANLSMSHLLETPYKDNLQMFPKTPGINSILSTLNTPMLRPMEYLLSASTFKDPKFLTPILPITPGSGFTPYSYKDIISPRSDQEIIYGAANRPTDYSSSSSYYKPDESDGIDKQIQASIQSAQTNSADEIEDSKIDDTTQNMDETQNTMNSSSSSSSSSSSDSDSDSDSSSSSDSETSKISHKSVEKDEQPAESLKLSPPKVINEDSTQIIKSHLVSTSEINIAQNVLLAIPEAPVLNEEAERLVLLEEKKRRMQESLRLVEMKNFKPKPAKSRVMPDAKRNRLRPPPVVGSPSKRKSTQPKKIVQKPYHSRQIYSHVVNVISDTVEVVTEPDVKAQSVTTERLITEAAGDNAIADASDVSTTQNPNAKTLSADEEESIEAIKSHLNKSRELVDNIAQTKDVVASKKISPESLIDMLSEKQKKFDANRSKSKTEVIEALPMPRVTRSRANNRMVIRPIQNNSAATLSKAKTASKPTEPSKEKRKSKESVPEQPAKKDTNEKVKVEPTKEALNKLKEKFITPAKERQKRQIRDIFGDCTDIETPIKSPPKIIATPIVHSPSPTKQDPTPPKEPVRESNKFEADSSNVKDSDSEDDDDDDEDDDDDDDSSEEDGFEMCLSIDESDKERYISIRENASVKSQPAAKPITIRTMNIVQDGITIKLAPSEEMEMYTQDVESVVEMNKERNKRRSTKETKVETSNEATSSSEAFYGKPLHTSTPSPTKTVTPKFNIKHKPSDVVSPKSAKRQNKDDLFNGIPIDDVLVQLHPTTE